MRFLPRCIFFLSLSVSCVHAGEASGVFGTVQDISGQVLPDADIRIQSESTGARWTAQTGAEGRYSVAGLPPGRYKVTARYPGFRTVSRVGAVLSPDHGLALDFMMELIGLHQVVTVNSGREPLDPSTGDSLMLSRGGAGAALPANGRDYRALFDLMPGVVITPASSSDAGQFTSNGQRPNANAFRIDGISANTGVGGSMLPGSMPGASLPAMTAIGSMENLGSSDTAQSVELRTSAFAPESGDRPGAEALITTRSGTNDFHADLFGALRDRGWNARDWFANSRGVAYPRPFYGNVGGVLGGPLWRNHTFFFFSGESSTLHDTGLQLSAVPSLSARQNAPPAVQPLLGSFPLPTGPDLGGGEAEGLLPLDKNASVMTYSLRLDQSLGRHGALFLRLLESPSELSLSSLWNANQGRLYWRSRTLGITAGGPLGTVHDLRLNYSWSKFTPWGSGWPRGLLNDQGWSFLPPTFADVGIYDPATAIEGLSIGGLGQFVLGGSVDTYQQQWEIRYTLARQSGRHNLRTGTDFIRLKPSRKVAVASVLGTVPDLQSLLDHDPVSVTASFAPATTERINTVSLFAQDTLRLTESLNLVYGVRWEITPPSETSSWLAAVTGLWNGNSWQSASWGANGAAHWPMRYGQIAPRAGIAYRLARPALVIRAGAGLFYDTTLGAAISPINGARFNSWQFAGGATGSNSSPGTLPSSGALTEDVRRFLGDPTPLQLPRSLQWRLALEKGISTRGTASVAYLGASGSHLLGNEAYIDPDTHALTRSFTLTRNTSNYQALQARYAGPLARSLYGSLSYTWSHSIDDGSQDSASFLVHPGYTLREARASSSFDVRHAFTAALSYRVPRAGWTVSGIFRVRTGFPIDVLLAEPALGGGFDNVGRPDLVPGVPVWIADPLAAGHRKLNPAAFRTPSGMTGTLGRNAIRGNGLAQFDASLRREFTLYRGLSAELGLNVFNVLNHPAFADPVPYLSSPWFGQSTSMQNLMLGSGSPNTGLPTLFQPGGARSAELRFRVTF